MFPDLKSFTPSVLRTAVPLVVAVVAGWPITQQLGIDSGQLTVGASVVVGGAYWLAVRAVETYVYPKAGWLLGWAGRPVYPLPADAGATGGPTADVVRVIRRSTPGV